MTTQLQQTNTYTSSIMSMILMPLHLTQYILSKPLHALVSLLAIQAIAIRRDSYNQPVSAANVLAKTGLFMAVSNLPFVMGEPAKPDLSWKDGVGVSKQDGKNKYEAHYKPGVGGDSDRYSAQYTRGNDKNNVYGRAETNDRGDKSQTSFQVGVKREL